jgi:plastocyanin
MRLRPWALAVAGFVCLAMGQPALAATTEVVMKDNVYIPESVSVAVGDTVTWVNQGRSPHNVTYGDKSKQSESIAPGGSYSITFDKAQTLYYYCSFHSAGSGKGMAGVVKVGTGGPVIGEPVITGGGDGPAGPRILRVPSAYKTIQKAVDSARPGDFVLVSPGVYKEQVTVTTDDITIRGLDRNTTIVDGEFKRAMGFLVQDADNVVIENITARYTTLNNFYWTGVKGFRGSYLTSYNSGDYGVYAFDSTHGVIEDSWASGSLDSGFYVGQCKPCHIVIRRIKASLSGLGYSGTNAGGDLVLTDSEWFDNFGGGITPNTLDSEENPPQVDIVITNNYVHGNQNLDAPYKDPAFASVYGVGIADMGGDENVIENNRVEDHEYFGILIQPIPGIGSSQEPIPINPTGNLYRGYDNKVRNNQVSGSGLADLAMGAPAGTGNCFEANTFTTSLPVAIETAHPCSGPTLSEAGGGDPAVTSVIAANFAAAASGERPPGDWKTQPVPGPQPNMKDPSKVVFRPVGQVPTGSGSGSGPGPGSGSGSGGAPVGMPKTGEPFPTLPVGLALLGAAGVWAGIRETRRRRT